MKKKLFAGLAVGVMMFGMVGVASATSVAIVKGDWYTPNLKNNLTSQGVTVTEIEIYTAASLSAYDSVIHYGNSYTDTAALGSYVSAGGNLIITPWAGLIFDLPSDLQIFDNGGDSSFSEAYPGVNLLAPADSLLAGVSFPGETGGFNIGRISGIDFAGGATQVADWADGTAMLGYKGFGLGSVIGVNMHVITSDTAYGVIDQPWATQLFVNAVNHQEQVPVPEPATMLLMGTGLAGLVGARRKKKK